jgi:hypothetical protein
MRRDLRNYLSLDDNSEYIQSFSLKIRKFNNVLLRTKVKDMPTGEVSRILDHLNSSSAHDGWSKDNEVQVTWKVIG